MCPAFQFKIPPFFFADECLQGDKKIYSQNSLEALCCEDKKCLSISFSFFKMIAKCRNGKSSVTAFSQMHSTRINYYCLFFSTPNPIFKIKYFYKQAKRITIFWDSLFFLFFCFFVLSGFIFRRSGDNSSCSAIIILRFYRCRCCCCCCWSCICISG
jgi:hypothetical protein